MFGRNYAHSFRLTRALFTVLGLLGVFLLFAWTGQQPEPSLERVIGHVVSVDRGEAQSRRTQSSVTLVTAVVELPDGKRTRIVLSGYIPEPGSSIHLFEEVHADGSRRYRYDRHGQSGL